jgi:glycosyltransferase involved in cell wall biosynthesis
LAHSKVEAQLRVLFLSRSLDLAGAERQLVVLARGLHERGHLIGVAVFYSGGELAQELARVRIPIFELWKKSRWDLLSPLMRLRQIVQKHEFQIVHGYLTTGNLMAWAGTTFASPIKCVAGFRSSRAPTHGLDVATKLSIVLERRLLRHFDMVICNSKRALADLSRFLIDKKTFVVPNGIDCRLFDIDREAGLSLRRQFGIPVDAPVLGAVMRRDPLKGADTLLHVVRVYLQAFPAGYALIVGSMTENETRKALTGGELSRVVLAGRQQDMRAAYNAMSAMVLPSLSEGFPNVVAEALACGTPCVVTDVGDAAEIVGDPEKIVKVGAVEELANAVCIAITTGGSRVHLRATIVNRYGVTVLVDRTEELLAHLVSS